MIIVPEKVPEPDEVVAGKTFVLVHYPTIGMAELNRKWVEGDALWHDPISDLVALKLKVPPVIQPRPDAGFPPIHNRNEGLVWHHRMYLLTKPEEKPANGNVHHFTLSAHKLEKSGVPMLASVETESFDTLSEAEEKLEAFRKKHAGLPVKVKNTETEEARWYYPKGQESDAEK